MTSQMMAALFLLVMTLVLIAVFVWQDKQKKRGNLRPIPAMDHLQKSINQAVEGGKGVHLSLGRAGVPGEQFGGSLMSLALLQYVTGQSVNGDVPPYVTTGDGVVNILSQQVLMEAYSSARLPEGYQINGSQVSGVTPFSYIAGTLMALKPEEQSVLFIIGNYGAEVALLADFAERKGIHTLSGTNDLIAQSILFVTTRSPLIGEEFFATGAYTQPSSLHLACLKTEDILRVILAGGMLVGAFLKLVGLV